MPETTYDPTKHRFGETVKFVPVAFVLTIIIGLWLIYTFYHLCPRPETEERWSNYDYAWAEALVFHASTFLLFVCYFRCILVHPGSIPEDDSHWVYVQAPDTLGGGGSNLTMAELAAVGVPVEKKKTGERRTCKWCSKYKPDRTHHCRVCRMCILKMDHHCPWIYNCVGFNNHKFFFLLLFYSTIDCHIIVWTMKDSMYAALDHPTTPFMSMFLLLFGETLTAFLGLLVTVFFLFHVWLMFKAMTTIEFCEKSMKRMNYDGSIYDRGSFWNVKAVLGDNIFLWFLPVAPPSGTGMNFQSEDMLLPPSPRHPGQSKDYGSLSAVGSQSLATGGETISESDRDVEGGMAPPFAAGSGDSGAPVRRKPISDRHGSAGTGAAPDFDTCGSEEEEGSVSEMGSSSRVGSTLQATADAATIDDSEQQAAERQPPEFTVPSV